jgi:methyltransferase (TIGR00027 family)
MRDDRASATARVIAGAILTLHSREGQSSGVPDEAARLSYAFLSTRWRNRMFARSAVFPPTRALWCALERMTLPGIVTHYANRKYAIERIAREQLTAGVEEIVVLGAGFDTLALRLANEFPNVKFVEVDHPATQHVKRSALFGALRPPANIKFVPLNLALGTPSIIRDVSPKSRLIIAEGLLMYFDVRFVRSMLKATLAGATPRTLLFTYMERVDDEQPGYRPRSRFMDGWLSRQKETVMWSIAPAEVDAFVKEIGGQVRAHIMGPECGPDATHRPTSLHGENLVCASNASAA